VQIAAFAAILATSCGESSPHKLAPPPPSTEATDPSAAGSALASDAGAPTVAAAPIDARVCAPLHVDVPALAIKSRHDVDVPDIVDFGSGLDPFFAKLAKLARGEPGTMVRIGFYGDSNMANDRTLGAMRRQLQALWGDGGHGWVSFGFPHPWYKHTDIEHGITGAWESYNLSSHHTPDYFYGFAGTAAESSTPGSTAWVSTAKATAPVGTSVTSFDVFYLARPKGGSFEVALDGSAQEVIDTANDDIALKFAHYAVAEGPHKLTVTLKKGKIRVFGVALERDAGIILDSIGIGSLNPWLLDTQDHAMAGVGLARRGYDLVVETTGSNMCASKWIASLLGVWHDALPHAATLLWTPPDAARKGTWDSEPLMKRCQSDKRGVAEAQTLGFWDLYAALGGYGSMPRWLREGWCEPDGLHLAPMLNKYIAERFAHALLTELARRAEKNPSLGCD
jgi:hypothetical protein